MSASPTHRVITSQRHEYEISTPVSAADLVAVLNAVRSDATAALTTVTDDTVQIRAYDDVLVAYWTQELGDGGTLPA